MKIGFASADWSTSVKDAFGNPVWGGSGWARLGQYADRLPADVVSGVLVSKGNIFGVRGWDGVDHFDCDIVYMQRYMFKDVADIMGRNKGKGQVIINDLDDWYWGLRPSNSAWQLTHPKFSPDENVEHFSKILANSTLLTVSTPYLKERISQRVNCNVSLLPNHVDLSRFTPRQHVSDQPVIGWVGSTAHRSGDLELLSGVLPAIAREGFAFHHSGRLESHPQFVDVVGVPATTLPLVQPSEYPDLFAFDIGLVPLTNTPFNLSKSYIKGLEYAAAGIPFIASNVGEYVRLRDEFQIGRIAKKPGDWKKHVMALRDPEVRAREAFENRIKLEAFDIHYGTDALMRIFNHYAS